MPIVSLHIPLCGFIFIQLAEEATETGSKYKHPQANYHHIAHFQCITPDALFALTSLNPCVNVFHGEQTVAVNQGVTSAVCSSDRLEFVRV